MLSEKSSKLPFLKETNEIGDLHLKSLPELKELLERQNNLLKNKFVVDKLNDKGEKIKNIKLRIEEELRSREVSTEPPEQNIANINAWEWRDPNQRRRRTSSTDEEDIKENVLQILAENGNIPKSNKFNDTPHVKKLIDTEHEHKFSFKPYKAVVDKKLKNIIPEAHVEEPSYRSTKYINLTESMDLLTDQFSTLKFIENVSKSKRAEECIEDRVNESNLEDTETPEACLINLND